jgi:hypothetical protein
MAGECLIKNLHMIWGRTPERENNGFNAFLLFAYGLLLKLPYFTHAYVPDATPADGFLFYDLLKFLAPLGRTAPVIYPTIA